MSKISVFYVFFLCVSAGLSAMEKKDEKKNNDKKKSMECCIDINALQRQFDLEKKLSDLGFKSFQGIKKTGSVALKNPQDNFKNNKGLKRSNSKLVTTGSVVELEQFDKNINRNEGLSEQELLLNVMKLVNNNMVDSTETLNQKIEKIQSSQASNRPMVTRELINLVRSGLQIGIMVGSFVLIKYLLK